MALCLSRPLAFLRSRQLQPRNYNHRTVSSEYLDLRRQFLQPGRRLYQGERKKNMYKEKEKERERKRRNRRNEAESTWTVEKERREPGAPARSAFDHILCDFLKKNSSEFSATFGMCIWPVRGHPKNRKKKKKKI